MTCKADILAEFDCFQVKLLLQAGLEQRKAGFSNNPLGFVLVFSVFQGNENRTRAFSLV